jgi:hypothetical protein
MAPAQRVLPVLMGSGGLQASTCIDVWEKANVLLWATVTQVDK